MGRGGSPSPCVLLASRLIIMNKSSGPLAVQRAAYMEVTDLLVSVSDLYTLDQAL